MPALSGFRDKLYWRLMPVDGLWHCFTRGYHRTNVYASLCGNHIRAYSGGQSCSRPKAVLRCRDCDVLEMRRRGWSESGPES
jgi:hypothetical protein